MAIVNGTPGDDNNLVTTLGDDIIYGFEGADYILADGQNNTSFGGNDTILGGFGNDIIYAYLGDDDLRGEEDNDQLFAGAGNDKVYGGLGNDIVDGEAGNDLVFGDAGNDLVVGGFGSDFLSGGEGNDTISSHRGVVGDFNREIDIMYGGAGADTFRLETDYLWGTGSLDPLIDATHARIEDFVKGEDILDVKYGSGYAINYRNYLAPGTAVRDTVISYQGDLVVIVKDVELAITDLT
jgi:Ca2+-binding RTX toxin-like protein